MFCLFFTFFDGRKCIKERTMDQQKLQECLEKNPFAKLGDMVADLLFDEIVSLRLAPSSKLNINNISKELGISRTPVTEAINQLCNIGFVEVRSNTSGYFVSALTMTELLNLYNARAAIESEAAYLCAETASYDVISGLENYASEYKRAFQRRDGQALKEVEMPFHRLIIDNCENKYLQSCYEQILPPLTRYQNYYTEFIDTDTANPWSHRVAHQHSAIVSAIKMHIPELARQLMNEHIRTGISQAAFSFDNPIPIR